MMIIGVDYHPSFQTIAFLIEQIGECGERELNHSAGEAEKFYREGNLLSGSRNSHMVTLVERLIGTADSTGEFRFATSKFPVGPNCSIEIEVHSL